MRDHIDDAFENLETAIVRHTHSPGAGAAIATAQRRRASRIGGVGVAVAGVAIWATVMASGGTPSVIEPAGDPSESHATEDAAPEPAPEVTNGFWMKDGDLPTSADGEWVIGEPHEFVSADSRPSCMADVFGYDTDNDYAFIQAYVQEAHLAGDSRQAVTHHVFDESLVDGNFVGKFERCVAGKGKTLELLVEHVLSGGATLYRVTGDEPYLLAVAKGPDWASVTFYHGPADVVDSLAPNTLDQDGIDGSLAVIAGLAGFGDRPDEADGDPNLPTEIPDGVWLQQDDLQAISPEEWTSFGPTQGLSSDTQPCVAEALTNAETVKYQQASTESGEMVIHYSALSGGMLGFDARNFTRVMELCAGMETLGSWDGTDTSTVAWRVMEPFDGVSDKDPRYLVGMNATFNGITVTVYSGPRVGDAEVLEAGSESPMTLAMRDLAGHGGFFAVEYYDACETCRGQ